jgi:hypothetical protein
MENKLPVTVLSSESTGAESPLSKKEGKEKT